jgi:hypothetical protein
MSELTRDLTSVLMAVVGVAILATLVSQRNQTSQVIGAASSGFASILSVAMGGGASSGITALG